MASRTLESRWLTLIGAMKMLEGLALSAVAFELFELIDQDVGAFAKEWVLRLHADPHNPMVRAVLGRAEDVGNAALEEYAAVAVVFGSLDLLQGVGLWLRRNWADYVCALATAAFIPLEIQELFEQPHAASAGMLLANAALVAFLVRRILIKRGLRTDPTRGRP